MPYTLVGGLYWYLQLELSNRVASVPGPCRRLDVHHHVIQGRLFDFRHFVQQPSWDRVRGKVHKANAAAG
jgi:hypothetical protein